MKKNYLLMVLLISSIMLWSQEKTVNGIVTDSDGSPLPGVSILIEGTTVGTESDFDGNYSLNVNEGKTLVFSFIGMVSQKLVIGTSATLNVTLISDTSQLDEVVVVGYGTTAKKDISGSIATIDSDAITERNVTNVSNALQGAVAGVTVTRSSSAPGAGSSIRIRGNTTLDGSNNPLILVDDVAVGNIDLVPYDQIESISVLKDGAASAIYGARASAGVIIITTKRAKTGRLTATYSGSYFVNSPTKEREYVDALDYMLMFNEQVWNDNGNTGSEYRTYGEALINTYRAGDDILDRDLYPDTDWADLSLNKNAAGQRHSINLSGGSANVKSSVFLSYETQDALYDHRDWNRLNSRINTDIKLSDKFGIVADVSMKLTNSLNPHSNPIGTALQAAPIYPAIWEDGRMATGKSGNNVYARLHSGSFRDSDQDSYAAKFSAYYKPTEDLKITFNVAPRYGYNKGKNWNIKTELFDADDPNETGTPTTLEGLAETRLIETRSDSFSLTTQALVDYNKSFGDHNISLLGGYEETYTTSESLSITGNEFTLNSFPYLKHAANTLNGSGAESEIASISGFGRLNYNYNSKYYVGATVRHDGSSRFAEDYRWGTFPSVSAAWTASNEDFMESISAINYLKFKGSYGTLGNDRIGNYLSTVVLQTSDVFITNGNEVEQLLSLAQLRLNTPDIQWETTISKNIGIELGLFNNRLSIEAEYFTKDTEDMLLSLSVPDFVGFEDPIVNVGDMNTKGFDFTTSWSDKIGDEFNYSASFNISDAKSIVGDINGKRLTSGVTLSEEGEEFRYLFGYKSAGLFQTQDEVDNYPTLNNSVGPGDVKLLDISGPEGVPDGLITPDDKTNLGSSLGHYQFGGTIKMDYKGFDFGLVFQGVLEKNFYLSSSYVRPFTGGWLTPSAEYAENHWSLYQLPAQNLEAKYPRLSSSAGGNNYTFSDFWLKSGAYLRIKTLSLGYTFKQDVLAKSPLSKIRMFVSANDWFTIDNLPNGVDPEQTSGTGYFLTKTFVVGITANF